MPDGTNVRFPDDMPKEQIRGLIASKFPELQEGSSGKVSSALDKRAADINKQVALAKSGQQTMPESQFQTVGSLAGGIGDVVAQGVQTGYEALPEFAQKGLQSAGKFAMQTKAGQDLQRIAPVAIEKWEEFKGLNPRAARNIEAAANIASLGLGSRGVSALEGAVEAPVKGVQRAGRVIKEAIPSEYRQPLKETPLPILSGKEIKDISRESFKGMKESDLVMPQSFTQEIYKGAKDLQLERESEFGTLGASESALSKFNADFEKLKDKEMTIKDIQALDTNLSKQIYKNTDSTTGRLNAEGNELYELQTDFREMLKENADKSGIKELIEGIDKWGLGLRQEELERILTKAKHRDNEATAIKAGLSRLADSKRFKSYPPEAQKLILQGASDTKVANFLRTVGGSRLLGTMIGGAGGGFTGAVAGNLASEALRGGAAALQKKQVLKAMRVVSDQARKPKDIGKLPPREAQKILNEGKK